MGCCLLAAFLIAGVRRAWFAVFPDRRPPVATFAPAASRPAPGANLELTAGGGAGPWAADQAGRGAGPWAADPAPRIGLPLVAAATVAAYALATWGLDLLGTVSTPAPLVRDVALA